MESSAVSYDSRENQSAVPIEEIKSILKPDKFRFRPKNLRLVLILSGKRKSGKDYISTLLTNHLGKGQLHNMAILRIAGPIKKEFALKNKLDFDKLLDSSGYKEQYRRSMVEWSEKYRARMGWNCFLEQAIEEQLAEDKRIWILNDARRLCDVEFFENHLDIFEGTKIIKLRVEACQSAREDRGWKFVDEIDNRETECGLDSYENWTHVIENNSSNEALSRALIPIFKAIDEALERSHCH